MSEKEKKVALFILFLLGFMFIGMAVSPAEAHGSATYMTTPAVRAWILLGGSALVSFGLAIK